MNKAIITAVLSTLAALAVTACAGSAHPAAGGTHPASGSAHPAQNTTHTTAGATCAQAGGIIQDLVNAQAVHNASQQTITDDLYYLVSLSQAAAIIQAGGPIGVHWSSAGSGQLNHDLYQFNADASTYTQANISMAPAVGSDIDALAADCGISATSSG
ncbi:MAG TPA: hypothetical protein VI365_03455 [Trebonia sp.]